MYTIQLAFSYAKNRTAVVIFVQLSEMITLTLVQQFLAKNYRQRQYLWQH